MEREYFQPQAGRKYLNRNGVILTQSIQLVLWRSKLAKRWQKH